MKPNIHIKYCPDRSKLRGCYRALRFLGPRRISAWHEWLSQSPLWSAADLCAGQEEEGSHTCSTNPGQNTRKPEEIWWFTKNDYHSTGWWARKNSHIYSLLTTVNQQYHWNPSLAWVDLKITDNSWCHGGYLMHSSACYYRSDPAVSAFCFSLILYDPVLVEWVAWWRKDSVQFTICIPQATFRIENGLQVK